MEGEAAAAVLQVLVQNLIDASKSEISLIRGLDKDAEKLTTTLLTIQTFLNDAETRTIPDDSVKNWLRKLEDAAFDADNVLDELNYHLISKQIKKAIQPSKGKKVLSCFSFCTRVARRRKMAVKIKEISENLDSINKKATELGLVEKLANVPTVSDVVGSETDSYTLDPIFVGREGVVSEIVEKILPANDERVVSILSIVGMGGMGKTTLTRKVFNNERIETKFKTRIWVHVSQNFDPIVILKKILKKFMSCDEGESREDTLKKLKDAFKDKVYLLVLDDVWNDDAPKWEDFINPLMGVTSTKGNAIVVTTRNTVVASIVNPLGNGMHQLQGLSEEDCWLIIKEKAFGKGVDAPSHFESIGRKIAGKCQGLPLAANVVGGVLQRDKSEENWVSKEQKWLSRGDGENITRILRLSFDSLSLPSLKKCFAYCSMFPKGYYIEKQELIEQWMAEGFLQPDDGSSDMESVGEKFINILLHSSLLQVLERDDGGNYEACSMHDHVHDLAISVLGTSDRGGRSSRVRYKFLDSESSPIDRSEMRYCRTLVMENFQFSVTDFSHFECLHVLTLSSYTFTSYPFTELPSSIKKLIHLRKLNILYTRIGSLPDWIGEFHYLQSLRADTGCMEKVPSTIKYLTKLRHLYLDPDTVLPAGIGGLTCLQTLRYFVVSDESDGCKIEELGGLNDLKGKLEIWNLERVRGKEEAAKANLFRKSRIMELGLTWDDLGLTWDDEREGEIENDENVLEGLQPHAGLKKLSIWGFKGRRFPAWAMKMAVQNVPAEGSWLGLNKLTEIDLGECPECEEIPMLGHLPNLKSLKLQRLSNVKRINSSGMHIVFPALERLVLEDMPKLAQVESDCGSEVFPRLQSLMIHKCEQLMNVGTHSLPCLKYLRIGTWWSSMPAANILFETKYGLLTELYLVKISNLERLPDVLFNENPNLSKLHIINCPKLREVRAGLLTLSSTLEELHIQDCPLLESITGEDYPSQSSFFFISLRIIEIEDCNALVWLLRELVGPSLEELHLKSLSSLKNLSNLMDDCMARSPRLNDLTVVGVPNFMASSGWRFGSLRLLDMDASDVKETMESVDGILQGCRHSLKELKIRGAGDCDRQLPESIQHLTALDELRLENYGIVEVPEWFGNLTSLPCLYIRDCKKLRRLPSMDAMSRLQRLWYLVISGCPELLAQGVADPEWPKLSHINYIEVDGTRLVADSDTSMESS